MAGTGDCAACGRTAELHEHHLVPRSCGGLHGPTTDICPNCHDLVHKAALDPSVLRTVKDMATRRNIRDLASIVARAEAAVKNDPNRSVVFQDRMPAELARKVAELASLHGCNKAEAVRLAIREEHSRWFGHARAVRA